MSGPVDLAEFLSAFVSEADEQLTAAIARLLAVEKAERGGKHDPRSVRDAFRALHTIKGLASMVGVDSIVVLAHAMEGVLRHADRSGGSLAAEAVEHLLRGVRAIEQRVRFLERGEAAPRPPEDVLSALEALADVQSGTRGVDARLALESSLDAKLAPFEREALRHPTEGLRAVRLDFAPSPDRAARGLTINSVRDRIGAIAEIVRVLPVSSAPGERAPAGFVFALLVVTSATNAELADAAGVEVTDVFSLQQDAPAPAATVAAPVSELAAPAPLEADLDDDAAQPRRNVVRVNVARVDDAMDRLGTLLATRARLSGAIARLASTGADTRELTHIAQENARQLRDLRSSILQVRMVSLAEVFERLPLVVRGLQRAGGKQVHLELESGGAELDKAVADLVFPAIVHLVRNAVDHAIEAPDERERAGKPAEGNLRVACVARSSNGLVLSIEDDGRGVDAPAVARAAGREVPADDRALLDIICQPGLTTREQVTLASGRGLGMDIVRRIVVDQLGGEMFLNTTPGKGTTFTLHVPLTVAIIDALLVDCASQRFAVPLTLVEEIIEVDAANIVNPPREVVRSDGRAPSLVEPFGFVQRAIQGRRETVSLYTLLRPPPVAVKSFKVLVSRRSGQLVGLVVDKLLGQSEAVVRPLFDPLVRLPGIAGAADLGDGGVTLVLDLLALTAVARPRALQLAVAAAPSPLALGASKAVGP